MWTRPGWEQKAAGQQVTAAGADQTGGRGGVESGERGERPARPAQQGPPSALQADVAATRAKLDRGGRAAQPAGDTKGTPVHLTRLNIPLYKML